jgi:outer membrane autotransporter protein
LGNLSIMELYAVAFDSNSKRLVVAMQDNGAGYQSAPGSSRYNVAVGGDGLNAVSAIINAGVGVQWTERISTYVGYQGQLGRDRYDANAVTGSVSFSF